MITSAAWGPALVLVQEEILGKLHAERGCALFPAALPEIHVGGFDRRGPGRSRCAEEMLVFGGSDRLDQDRGDVLELHHAPFLAAGAGQVGDQLRLKLVLVARGVVLQGDNLRNPAAGELDHAGFLVEVGFRPGEDWMMRRDGSDSNRSGCRAIRYSRCGGARRRCRWASAASPTAHRFGGGENLGVVGERAGAQLLVDYARVAVVEEGEGGQDQDDEQRYTPGPGCVPAVPGRTARGPNWREPGLACSDSGANFCTFSNSRMMPRLDAQRSS